MLYQADVQEKKRTKNLLNSKNNIEEVNVMYVNDLGKIIKRERKAWGMSRRRLGKLTNLEFDEVEEFETGINKNPSFYLMLKICDALQISIFSLLSEEGYKSFILNKLT